MSEPAHHISVCICTYRRPELLRRLLDSLRDQQTNGLFTYSITVADNDSLRSAEPVVSEFAGGSQIPVRYCVEPERSVSLTRNRAIENSSGDFIAFIDDDEFTTKDWLRTLFAACLKDGVAGVLGPVDSHFDEPPPKWVLKGNFYHHSVSPTGSVVEWTTARTGNVLLKKGILPAEELPFRPQFRGGGADQDFFRRLIENGNRFIWCEEAVAYEVVPPLRWKRSFMLRRALLRGGVTPLHPTFGAQDILKSVVAVPAYTLAVPFALVLGHHRFMRVMISLCDHLGKLLACLGIRPIKVAYVTE
jgi:succinoglycan biosynthesis protein ExoM